jgi:hypothetical protein
MPAYFLFFKNLTTDEQIFGIKKIKAIIRKSIFNAVEEALQLVQIKCLQQMQ